ncbi:polysaccharide pyruvyl transferase family protein [Thiohalorhabdus methylotrophus]|uniref:Polysaccharide pyruvyl transferase family protein n=1 Tax=Thiohalorhabdus methylotrophus TaxID=3242694 RepID=A0ABV4TWP4_9GAMM
MKISITNAVALNGGDAAILTGMHEMFREAFGPEVRITVFDKNPEVSAVLFPDMEFRESPYFLLEREPAWAAVIPSWKVQRFVTGLLRRLRKAGFWASVWKVRIFGGGAPHWMPGPALRRSLEAYLDSDAVVSAGGTYLVESYSMAPQLFDYRLAIRLGKPLYLFTQSMGPFRSPWNRKKLYAAFRHARLIFLRDPVSLEHVRSLGKLETPLVQAADAAFVLREQAPLPGERAPSPPGRFKVVVSVREWGNFSHLGSEAGMENYKKAIRDAVSHLVTDHGAEVLFLSTCQGVPQYATDDAKLATEIVLMLGERERRQVSVHADFIAAQGIREMLSDCDFVIATRLHMAILALTMEVPVLPVAYEYKTAQLFERMGLGEWVTGIEDMDDAFCGRVDRFIERLPALRRTMLDFAREESARARMPAYMVREDLAGGRFPQIFASS